MPSKKLFLLFIITLIVFISLSFLGTGFFYYQYQNSKRELEKLLTNPDEFVKSENKRLIEKVAAIYDVPKDEEPTIVVVNDLTPLKNQAFFARAKVGDRVLVYNIAKKAILYDPRANKIIEVAPIVAATPTPNPAGTEESGKFYLAPSPTLSPSPTRASTPTPSPTP